MATVVVVVVVATAAAATDVVATAAAVAAAAAMAVAEVHPNDTQACFHSLNLQMAATDAAAAAETVAEAIVTKAWPSEILAGILHFVHLKNNWGFLFFFLILLRTSVRNLASDVKNHT